jgi:two-component system chemotaxis response regulator CheY
LDNEKSIRVLTVDDSAIIRYRLRILLSAHGFEIVAEAESGNAAVWRYQEENPDLVTMDITMPNMDGITAIKKILEINPNACIVVISAMGQKSIVLDAVKAGAMNFIIKPFEDNHLIDVLKKAYEEKSSCIEK